MKTSKTPKTNYLINQTDYARRLTYITGVIFVATLILCAVQNVLVIKNAGYVSIDTTVSIMTSEGVFGACVCFYLNIEKSERLTILRIKYLRYKMVLKGYLTADEQDEMFEELIEVDETLKNSIAAAHETATNTEIDIQNY